MCEATTIALAVMAVGTAVSAGMTYYQGQQANKIAKANAQIADNNADRAEQVGRVNEALARDELRHELARQRARISAAGVDLSDGTSIDFGQEAGEQAYLETQRVRIQTEDAARNFRTDAALSRAEGRMARISGAVGAFTTLTSSAGSFAGAGGSFKSSGAAFKKAA